MLNDNHTRERTRCLRTRILSGDRIKADDTYCVLGIVTGIVRMSFHNSSMLLLVYRKDGKVRREVTGQVN